jgi:hypothetical protein
MNLSTTIPSGSISHPSGHILKGRFFIQRRLLLYQVLGFVSIIALIWINEIIDLPHFLLGSPLTKINWREAVLESAAVSALGATVLVLSRRLLMHIKYLEGFLVVCAFCKKIKVRDGVWVPIDQFITNHAEVVFSHSYCPECLEEHYGHVLRRSDRIGSVYKQKKGVLDDAFVVLREGDSQLDL